MFDDFENDHGGSGSQDDAFKILQELEQNQPDELRKQRTHFRVAVKAEITLQPGNSSDRLKFKVRGVTGDISQSGLGALFPIPTGVGDIYRLEFDQSKIELPVTMARCVRCRLVRDDAFECGFLFFSNIALPRNLSASTTAGTA